MTVQECVLCGCALTEANSTDEHIISNAIGGRKKVAGFICRNCNSETGSKWDSELARQLNPLSLYLGIRRQRGSVPSETFPTLSGGSVRVGADGRMTTGKPEMVETVEGDATRIHVNAPNMREMRRQMEGLRRKHPQLRDRSLDDLMSSVRIGSYYSRDPIEISREFGGYETGRSLVKSAVALVYDAGIDPKRCDLALDYLLNEDTEPCFGYFYERGSDLVVNRPAKLPFHCVHVEGCSSTATLLGYVEFYGIWRMVLCLSETYSGRDFSHTYAIDPVNGEEMNVLVKMDISVSDIREAYEYKRYDHAVQLEVILDVFSTVREVGFNRALNRVAEEAADDAFANLGAKEGELLTDEQIEQVIKDVATRLGPFLAHNLTRPVLVEDDGDDW